MTTTTKITPAVFQFRSGRIYPVYCRKCGAPIPHGQGHIAGMSPARDGFNCDSCFERLILPSRYY